VTKTTKKPVTTRFTKEIVTEGKYRTFDRNGKKTLKELTAEDIDKAVATFDKMRSKGLKVPAPWKHDFGITTFTKITEGDGGLLEDSSKNAGFWDKMFTKINEKGKKVLYGEIEVPGSVADTDSPASKVGSSVQDVSIYMRPTYEMTDETGEMLENVLMHVALVTHPIEPGQKNFEVLPDPNDVYIAMSEYEADPNDLPETDVSFTELSGLLAEVAGIYLPASTTAASLVSNLTVALNQLKLMSKKESDDDGPESTPFRTEPIVMSSFTQTQLAALTKTINPDTGKPFTAAELGAVKQEQKGPTQDQLVMSAMANHLQDQKRQGLRERINSLVEKGQCPKAFADTELYPKADNYVLEFDGQNVRTQPVEAIIMSLQAMPAKAPPKSEAFTYGSFIDNDDAELSDEEGDKIAEAMVSLI
jgi:hypothetical protein